MPAFQRAASSPFRSAADAVVVGVAGDRSLSPPAAEMDRALDGALSAHLQAIDFTGKLGDVALVPTLGRVPASTIAVIGTGAGTPDDLRRAAGAAARRTATFPTVAVALGDDEAGAQAVVEGFLLGSHRFDRYKSAPEPPSTTTTLLLGDHFTDRALTRGQVIGGATAWARDLINEPAGGRGPQVFADLARARAEGAGLEVTVLDERDLAEEGMGGILGVGQGSRYPPRLLILRYRPGGPGGTPHVGVVGKGITFDSGGLSLKPADSMETMKTDCSGAAAVVAAMCALPALGAAIDVTAACPLAENMPGGAAIKPGDVIRHFGGRTSEVLNTDAEGRLVLADALAWMATQQPEAIVDLATLTGAMVIALGKKVAGYFATTPALAQEIDQAAAATGEKVWQMPLLEEYRSMGDSEVADLKNIGTRWGGAIFAALFLKPFTGGVPWAHLDIAGPARSDETEHHIAKGPTGMGTRLLIDWVEGRAAAAASPTAS